MADEAKKDETKKESGPKKTVVAREIAQAVLAKAKEPMKMSDLIKAVLADPKAKKLGIASGTVSAQVSRDANSEDGKIKRTAPSTYALR